MPELMEVAAQQQQYLTFHLAGEEYAVGILKAKEILEYDTITKVPQTPAWIKGVFNLRGSVVPVIDLRLKFGLGDTLISATSCIVIIETSLGSGNTILGVLVDSVSQVIEVNPTDVEAAPSFGAQVRVDYLLGMIKMERKFALILDIDKILSTEELFQVSELELTVPAEHGGAVLQSAKRRRKNKQEKPSDE